MFGVAREPSIVAREHFVDYRETLHELRLEPLDRCVMLAEPLARNFEPVRRRRVELGNRRVRRGWRDLVRPNDGIALALLELPERAPPIVFAEARPN